MIGIEVVHAIENAQQGRLAAARGPNEGGHFVLAQRQADVLERRYLAVIEAEVADIDLFREIGVMGSSVDDGWNTQGSNIHDDFLGAAKIRAMMESVSTLAVIINAPLQASFCHST